MGVIWSFVRRSLAANKTRTAVTIIGVVLSTALLMAVFTTVTSLQNTVIESVYANEGAWHIFDSQAEENWQDLLDDSRITTVITSRDVGVSLFKTNEQTDEYNRELLAVRSLPNVWKGTEEDANALTKQPTLVEGRMPENEDEIIIPQSLVGLTASADEDAARWDGALAVGSTIQMALGQRSTPSGRAISSYYYLNEYSLTEEDYKASNYDPQETVINTEERSFTVVGAYEDQLTIIDELGGSNACLVAFTSANAGFKSEALWLSTEGFTSRDEMDAVLDPILGIGDYVTHSSLLNYIGLTSSADIWRSVWTIVGVLAATIMIAAVSLIFNSFAISVAERTRQLGLLSSLGASRRQLGWSVILEALAIGVIGIPIGIAVGIAGVAVTLSVSGQALSDLLGTYGTVSSSVHVSPVATLIVIVLSFVTLLISAVVPALRAGRVSATDAIRQTQDVHLDRRTERKLKKAHDQGKLLLSTGGIRELVGGIGGLLASRNLRRSGSRGRVVVASLAVSVLLLVTSGAISQALRSITDRYQSYYGMSSSDIVVVLYTDADDETPQPTVNDLKEYEQKLSGIEGVEHAFTAIESNSYVALSSGTCSNDLSDVDYLAGEVDESSGVYADGSFVGWGNVIFVDEATWQNMLAQTDLSTDNPNAELYALIVDRFEMYDEQGRYLTLSPIANENKATFYYVDNEDVVNEFGEEATLSADGMVYKNRDGQVMYGLKSYDPNVDAIVADIAVEEIARETATIDIAGTVTELPGDLYNSGILGTFPMLILPISQFDIISSVLPIGVLELTYNIEDGADMEQIEADFEEALQELPTGMGAARWENTRAELELTRRIFDMVYLFIFLFSLITMLIAVANVFNTLSNNIILRTREFAVLKSCGMDNKAFARMLLSECASYAVRGLVIGLGLATLAAYAIWKGMSASFVERPFTLPWGYVAAAVIGVVVVLAISVAYALRRSHALNVVEALRADAI